MKTRRSRRGYAPPPDVKKSNINENIRARKVLVIDKDGNKRGIMHIRDAIDLARESDLDLVEVSPNADPPVCRIINHGKFLFEKQKREKENKKKSASQDLKEIRLRPATDENDLLIKARKASEFIEEGHKVQINVKFRGREMAHGDIGAECINKLLGKMSISYKLEQSPTRSGRSMSCLISPNGGAKK